MSSTDASDGADKVVIDYAHRGDIKCHSLVILPHGSVNGYIEAVDVRNHGRIRGVVNASEIYISAEGASVYGNVFAPKFGRHPISTHEGSSSTKYPFEKESVGVTPPRALAAAVTEGIRRELAGHAQAPAAAPVSIATSEPAAPPAVPDEFSMEDEDIKLDITHLEVAADVKPPALVTPASQSPSQASGRRSPPPLFANAR